MKYFGFFLISLFLLSCGAAVNYDYDTEADFSKYNSYNYFPNISSGLSELDNQRIINATDSILSQRGFVRSENHQFLINFYSKEYTANSRSTIGVGMGGTGRNVGIGVSGGIPVGGRSINQQLTIDFIDTSKDALVWQAVIESDFSERSTPQQKEKHYYSILQKALSKYPPK